MSNTIFKSRKFWLMIGDVVVSLVTYFVGKYVNPDAAKDILFLIAALQPVFISVIAAITVQNLEGQKTETQLTRLLADASEDSEQ